MDLGIDITKYFASDINKSELKVYESALDGITFRSNVKATLPDKNNLLGRAKTVDLINALRSARTSDRKAFRMGNEPDLDHFPVDSSMAATTGVGFREIIYLDYRQPILIASQLNPALSRSSGGVPEMNAVFSSHFGSTRVQLDITSLHCAVAGSYCSIHIDHTGFVLNAMPGMGTDVFVTADALQHTLVELIWKDKMGVLDGIEIYLPNSRNDFSRLGFNATKKITDNINFSIDISYNIRGKKGISGAMVLGGRF